MKTLIGVAMEAGVRGPLDHGSYVKSRQTFSLITIEIFTQLPQ